MKTLSNTLQFLFPEKAVEELLHEPEFYMVSCVRYGVYRNMTYGLC